MPNYCVNKVRIEGLTPEKVEAILDIVNGTAEIGLFNYLKPTPDKANAQVSSWGTRCESIEPMVHYASMTAIELSFSSVLAAPTALYRTLLDQGDASSIISGWSDGFNYGIYSDGYEETYDLDDRVDFNIEELYTEQDSDSGIYHEYTESQNELIQDMQLEIRDATIKDETGLDMSGLGLGG